VLEAAVSDSVPTDRELEALKVLWDRGEATVREIADAINAEAPTSAPPAAPGKKTAKDDLAYTTVLSLLQVMEQKGLVDHRRAGKAYVYFPRVEREPTFRQLAGSFLNKVFDGAVGEYLVHALDGKKLSTGELDELEAMIAAARKNKSHSEQGKRSKKGGRK
jgi:BlaI family transcriptional regulator, penicillinase repressor